MRAFLFCLLSFACGVVVVGCVEVEEHPPLPMKQWKIELIRPNGGVQKHWIVDSVSRPLSGSDYDGVQWVRGLPGSHSFKRYNAPIGWFLDVTPYEHPTAEIEESDYDTN